MGAIFAAIGKFIVSPLGGIIGTASAVALAATLALVMVVDHAKLADRDGQIASLDKKLNDPQTGAIAQLGTCSASLRIQNAAVDKMIADDTERRRQADAEQANAKVAADQLRNSAAALIAAARKAQPGTPLEICATADHLLGASSP